MTKLRPENTNFKHSRNTATTAKTNLKIFKKPESKKVQMHKLWVTDLGP